MYLDEVKRLLQEAGTIAPSEFHPCTEEEVEVLEYVLGFALPANYKAFLLCMGKRAGDFMVGSNFYFEDLLEMQDAARRLLQENEFPHSLPTDAFVVFMHQGYQFNFLRVQQGNASPVYRYYEGRDKTEFARIYDTFEESLLLETSEHIAI